MILPKIIVTNVDGHERVEMDDDYCRSSLTNGESQDAVEGTPSIEPGLDGAVGGLLTSMGDVRNAESNERAGLETEDRIIRSKETGSGDIGSGQSNQEAPTSTATAQHELVDVVPDQGAFLAPETDQKSKIAIPREAFKGLKVVDPVMELWRACMAAEKARPPLVRPNEAVDFQCFRLPSKAEMMPDDSVSNKYDEDTTVDGVTKDESHIGDEDDDDDDDDEALKELAAKLVNTAITGAVEICS